MFWDDGFEFVGVSGDDDGGPGVLHAQGDN